MNTADMIFLLDELIVDFIERGEIFTQSSCYLPGLYDAIKGNGTKRVVYDHEYFGFVKSTKSFKAANLLIQEGMNEDAYIIIRSIFENYLSIRYLNTNPIEVEKIVINKIKEDIGIHKPGKGGWYDENNNKIADFLKISSLQLGNDTSYYNNFYSFLSKFAHSNFSILDYYLDDYKSFSIYIQNDMLMVRLYLVFVYTKIFENVVTVELEDFASDEEERRCYEIVKRSLKLQNKIYKVLIGEIDEPSSQSEHDFKKMFINMKKSLKEELGSISKNWFWKKSQLWTVPKSLDFLV